MSKAVIKMFIAITAAFTLYDFISIIFEVEGLAKMKMINVFVCLNVM